MYTCVSTNKHRIRTNIYTKTMTKYIYIDWRSSRMLNSNGTFTDTNTKLNETKLNQPIKTIFTIKNQSKQFLQ